MLETVELSSSTFTYEKATRDRLFVSLILKEAGASHIKTRGGGLCPTGQSEEVFTRPGAG